MRTEGEISTQICKAQHCLVQRGYQPLNLCHCVWLQTLLYHIEGFVWQENLPMIYYVIKQVLHALFMVGKPFQSHNTIDHRCLLGKKKDSSLAEK